MRDYLSELLGPNPPDPEKENPAPVAAGNGVEILASLDNCLSQDTLNSDDLLGPSSLDLPFDLSVFPDVYAKRVSVERLTIRQLADKIRNRQAKTKKSLPLLKMATFGSQRSEEASLRHDANLESVSGVEGDYDAGLVSPQEAAHRLRRANVAALVYTTSRHAPDAPRWRVLCPLSQAVSPGEREALCERVNGALGGILASESFNRSLSYYFGGLTGQAAPEVHLIEGRTVDQAVDVPRIPKSAIGPDARPQSKELAETDPDDDDLFAIIKADPLDLNDLEVDSYIAGLPQDWLEDREDWFNVGAALSHQYRGGQIGFEKWCEWSRQSKKFDLKDSKRVWKSFKGKTSNPITFRSIIAAANENRDPLADLLGTVTPDASFFEPVSNWAGTPAPPREWLVPEFIPNGAVTLLSGDGGTGKSLIALQLGVAVATGKPWLGQPIDRPGKVLFLSAEDTRDELHRRLEAICNGDLSDLGSLHVRSVVEVDPLLATFDRQNRMKTTELFAQVHAAVERVRPSLVVLDTLANLHSGDENNKAHAMQFVNRLKAIATKFNCAVLLLTHPSLSGMTNGSGAAGSVGWSNSVRSRLFLSRIKDKDDREWDEDVRSLTTTKSNYGRNGSRIDVRWHYGKFVAQGDAFDAIEGREEKAERVFLKLLARFTDEGTHVSRNQSPTYAPVRFADQPDSEGCSKVDLEDAMNRLFLSGRLVNAPHKSKGQLRQHIEEIDQDQFRDGSRNAATVAATLPQHPSATVRDPDRNGPRHTPILPYMSSALGALDEDADPLRELLG